MLKESALPFWNTFKPLLVILLEGFVTVSLEILTIRQLIPFVGNNVIVTSLIIGTFLLFLAIGYWRGGQRQERFYEILQRNFYIAATIMIIGISYLFLEMFFQGLTLIFHLKINIIILLSLYLLFIIAPLIYILGQTVPITMNLVKQEKLVGAVGGKVLFLSTIGSFFGSILTSLLLMEFLGVAITLFINFCIILLLALAILIPKKRLFLHGVFIAILIYVGYNINVDIEKHIFSTTNNYANYSIVSPFNWNQKNLHGKLFKINNSYSSFIGINHKNFAYMEKIKNILFNELKLHNKDILIVGAGGFTLSEDPKTPPNNFTYVDIDPKIKNIAEHGFIKKVNGKFIGKDARIFLQQNQQKYDVILSDAYSNVATIPASLVTFEYFKQLKDSLKNDGLAIFNIIGNPLLRDNYSKRVDTTLRAVFHNCTATPISYTHEKTNIIYVCSKTTNENDQKIYGDDLNSATLDNFLSGS